MSSVIISDMNHRDHKSLTAELFYASLKAVDPYESVKRYTEKIHYVYQHSNHQRLIITGFGKASCSMAEAIEDHLPDLITQGIIITKYGHCPSLHKLKKIQVFEASHPVPDENGLRATEKLIQLIKISDEKTLIVCLISGGGSALLVSPNNGITLDEKRLMTDLLLRAGANIDELNTVRKHISRVKGGKLAEIAYPSRVISLILSDVIGDRLDVIASGPTSPDNTTYQDALSVLMHYHLTDMLPRSVVEILERGSKGLLPETPKEGTPLFKKVDNIIIGSNKKALEGARTEAEKLLHAEILTSEITGEARDVGKWLAQKAKETRDLWSSQLPMCLISGGETTVTVKGNGIGGRNMELALAFVLEIEGIDGVTLLSAGTDGTDGPTDAAGAIVDSQTIKKARSLSIDPEEYLKNNDSYTFFKKIDELFITGPTGTNVMDIQIVVIE
jgi:glycerate 2-kinase